MFDFKKHILRIYPKEVTQIVGKATFKAFPSSVIYLVK